MSSEKVVLILVKGVGEKCILAKNVYFGKNTQHTISHIFTDILFYQLTFHQHQGTLVSRSCMLVKVVHRSFANKHFPPTSFNNIGTVVTDSCYPWSQNDHFGVMISFTANDMHVYFIAKTVECIYSEHSKWNIEPLTWVGLNALNILKVRYWVRIFRIRLKS